MVTAATGSAAVATLETGAPSAQCATRSRRGQTCRVVAELFGFGANTRACVCVCVFSAVCVSVYLFLDHVFNTKRNLMVLTEFFVQMSDEVK